MMHNSEYLTLDRDQRSIKIQVKQDEQRKYAGGLPDQLNKKDKTFERVEKLMYAFRYSGDIL